MTQIFGEFIDEFPPEHDSLELTFTPTSRSLKQRWRNNRLSAHFVADYFSTFLPLDDRDIQHQKRIKESKSAVSYLANELLENAMKFNDYLSKYYIKFGIHFLENKDLKAVIFATNSISEEGMKSFQKFILDLLSSDPEILYVEQIEKSVEEEADEASGLGLLTMINDYEAKLGWKFETISSQPQLIIVTSMAQIQV